MTWDTPSSLSSVDPQIRPNDINWGHFVARKIDPVKKACLRRYIFIIVELRELWKWIYALCSEAIVFAI